MLLLFSYSILSVNYCMKYCGPFPLHRVPILKAVNAFKIKLQCTECGKKEGEDLGNGQI